MTKEVCHMGKLDLVFLQSAVHVEQKQRVETENCTVGCKFQVKTNEVKSCGEFSVQKLNLIIRSSSICKNLSS